MKCTLLHPCGQWAQYNTPHSVMTSTTCIWINGWNGIINCNVSFHSRLYAFWGFANYNRSYWLSIRVFKDFANANTEASGLILLFRIAFQATTHRYHYIDVIMGTIASQITSLTIYSDADQSKYQSSASLAFVRGIHRRPMNSPHKWPVTRKMFPFQVMTSSWCSAWIDCFWIEVHADIRFDV